jgi:hypothetical protein
MARYYRLEGKKTVPIEGDDVLAWANTMDHDNKHVGHEILPRHRISTVFLGLNHAWGEGPPMLFETMIFYCEPWMSEYQTRCSTYRQAEGMHKRAIKHVFYPDKYPSAMRQLQPINILPGIKAASRGWNNLDMDILMRSTFDFSQHTNPLLITKLHPQTLLK